MIEDRDLVKRYGATPAVNDLSFTIRLGLVTGFLGANGAGKTTTMRRFGSSTRWIHPARDLSSAACLSRRHCQVDRDGLVAAQQNGTYRLEAEQVLSCRARPGAADDFDPVE